MDNDILARMEAEERALTDKLNAVRQLLAVYRGEGQKPAKAQAVPRVAKSQAERIDKFGPYGQRIIEVVSKLLPGNTGNPVPTRVLVDKLAFRNVEITGENKVNSLSALLARSSAIKGYGRAGWTLQREEPGEEYLPAKGRNENGAAEAAPDAGGVAAPSPGTGWTGTQWARPAS